MKIFRPIWAEIDCDSVEHNMKLVREKVGPDVKVMCVVKADAYGHGAVAVSRSLLHAGADCLAVASLEEAVQLRKADITADILILGYTQPNWASVVVEGGFVQTVYHLGLARALSAEAKKQEKPARVHIKIDTGMSRIGIAPEQAMHLVREIYGLEGVKVEGLYSHLSCADEQKDNYSKGQLKRFQTLLNELDAAGIKIPVRHIANSAASVRYPESHFDLVRPGIILYGLTPAQGIKSMFSDFRPVMTIKSTIVELKTLPEGTPVSYGGTHVTGRATRVATLPAGYADGFSRRLSNKGCVLVNGYRAPIIGNICMDFMMVDVTDVPDVRVEDDAVLIGREGSEEITVDEMASIMGTINYEVVSLIGKRVQRVYTNFTAGTLNGI